MFNFAQLKHLAASRRRIHLRHKNLINPLIAPVMATDTLHILMMKLMWGVFC